MTHCSRSHGHRAVSLTLGLGALFASLTLLACSSATVDQAEAVQDVSGMPPAMLQQQLQGAPFGLRPLSQEPVPQPTGTHIKDLSAAIRLGKAFFWDNQAGSDGTMACAVCHASFGSDARRLNTLHPGPDGIFASGGVTGPGQLYTPVVITNDDIVGVQGVPLAQFVALNPDPHIAKENCDALVDPKFGTNRGVEFRQAPMIYGAAFLRQLFWAGEASDEFNGITIWGFTPNGFGVSIVDELNSALASQAVGPVNNFREMACFGRPLLGVGDSFGGKMLTRPPLQFQRVSPTDSVLGSIANPNGPGLLCNGTPCTSYRGMIEQAFGTPIANVAEDVFTVVWGEAIQAYETTLIPDQTPFDRFFSGHIGALSPRQILGLATFVGRGNCVVCHAGAMLSDATVSHFQANGAINRDGGDQGFHNIGIVNNTFDLGRGDFGPAGATFTVSGSPFDDFAFKTPTLRNVGLTGPYFHTGAKPTLEDVVDFYNNGGDVANPQRSADIRPLHLTNLEKRALVDFMRNGLTDCRVLKQRAPFDHPELPVPNGTNLAAVGAEGIGSCHDRDDDDDDDGDHGHGHGHGDDG
jgi:cytochrome c peroxidase